MDWPPLIPLGITAIMGLIGTFMTMYEDVPAPRPGEPDRTTRRPTVGGIITIVLILLSFASAAVLEIKQGKEVTAEKQLQLSNSQALLSRSADTLNKSETTLQGVSRLLARINDVGLTVRFRFSIDHPAFAEDLAFTNELPRKVKKWHAPFPKLEGVMPADDMMAAASHPVRRIAILPASPYNPFHTGKSRLRELLHRMLVYMEIRKNFCDGTNTNQVTQRMVWQSVTVPNAGKIEVDLWERTAVLEIHSALQKPPLMSDGQVASLHDLPGCILEISRPLELIAPISDAVPEAVASVLAKCTFEPLTLHIDGLHFDLRKLKPPPDEDKEPADVSTFVFPSGFVEVMKTGTESSLGR